MSQEAKLRQIAPNAAQIWCWPQSGRTRSHHKWNDTRFFVQAAIKLELISCPELSTPSKFPPPNRLFGLSVRNFLKKLGSRLIKSTTRAASGYAPHARASARSCCRAC